MREKQLPRSIVITRSFFGISVCCLLALSILDVFGGFSDASASETIAIPEQNYFRDFSGNRNVAGVVKNDGIIPVHVVVGLNTTTKSPNSDTKTEFGQIPSTTYGRIVYPSSSSPFKF